MNLCDQQFFISSLAEEFRTRSGLTQQAARHHSTLCLFSLLLQWNDRENWGSEKKKKVELISSMS